MNTLFVGQSRIHLAEVDSTNSYATGLLLESRPQDGTVVYTFDQKKGRGQRGNGWECEPRANIALSIIMYPSFLKPSMQFYLSVICSLAISDVMAELMQGTQPSVKWPNDVYIGERKIAGVLIENNLRASAIESSVFGIGININQRTFSTAPNATSMLLESGTEHDPLNVLSSLCSSVEARYLQLKAEKYQELRDDYLSRLYRRNMWSQYASADKEITGKIVDVSPEGKLCLQHDNGTVFQYGMKEIAFL
jgi:BirA family biotin operon repressor/biotin-[acetyl-CoA-carboxylase] ligase